MSSDTGSPADRHSHTGVGLMRLMETDDAVTGPINLGNPHEIRVRELAERVVRLTDAGSALVHRPLPADGPA